MNRLLALCVLLLLCGGGCGVGFHTDGSLSLLGEDAGEDEAEEDGGDQQPDSEEDGDAGEDEAGEEDGSSDDPPDEGGEEESGEEEGGPDLIDADGDGWDEDEDCDDLNPEVHPAAEEIACDAYDNDCDGFFHGDDVDDDGDGYSECLGDCDDAEATIGNNAVEVVCDGIDQDCDGVDDCTEPSGSGGSGSPTGSVCAASTFVGPTGGGAQVGSLDASDATYGSGPFYYFDSYEVLVLLPGLYYADLSSTDFDAWVEIYDSSCALVAYDDDSLGGTDASVSFLSMNVGESYYVVASSLGELATGSYSLSVY